MTVDPFPNEPTAQAQWFDANVRHQIGLLRVAGGLRNRLHKLLNDTEADLRHSIADILRKHGRTNRPADLARKEKLLREVEAIRNTAWEESRGILLAEMQALAIAEPRFMDALLRTVLPVQIETTLPPAAQLRAIVTARPFEGRILRDWADTIAANDVARIQSQIQIGLTQGEDLQTITRRVVGTVQLRGTNGATELGRRDAETITRTAVNHTANQARAEFFKANADIVDEELFIATLDSRTTPVCRSYDGDRFPLGEGPMPPLHMRCRSIRTAILDPEPLGERPMNPTTERGLLREFAAREGFKAPRDRDGLPRGTKGKFDKWARGRARELIGQVPAKTTYLDFLRRQPAAFQDDVLGAARGRLFRAGGLDLKAFVDRTGAEIPLRELAKMHAAAFRAAGLNPAEFLTN